MLQAGNKALQVPDGVERVLQPAAGLWDSTPRGLTQEPSDVVLAVRRAYGVLPGGPKAHSRGMLLPGQCQIEREASAVGCGEARCVATK
jgi:hypothetical protein